MKLNAIIIGALFFIGCDFFSNYSGNSTAKVSEGTVDLEKDILVDVREVSEINSGMVIGAQWLSTSDIKSESPRYNLFMKKLEKRKGKTIYLHCASGYRSSVFQKKLSKLGYNAVNLGGYQDAIKNGLESFRPNLTTADSNCEKFCF